MVLSQLVFNELEALSEVPGYISLVDKPVFLHSVWVVGLRRVGC